jgi:catechol 2,3-dioxygenase-like lactoylglutathione lyase family enzyme
MISGVGAVAVLVNDPNELAEWYRAKLGFEILVNKGHAVFIRPRGSPTLIHLCGKCDAWGSDRPGGRTGVWLHCGKVVWIKDKKSGLSLPFSEPSGVERTYHQLRKKGVEFSEPLTATSWGKYAVLRDPDGNEYEMG